MKFHLYDSIKVLGANITSWAATFLTISVHEIHTVVMILAGLGSLGVSIVSIIWIRKQTVLLGKKE